MSISLTHSYKSIFLCIFLCAFAVAPAHAKRGKISSLNDGNVKAFIEKTSHMTGNGQKSMPISTIKKYLDKHIEKRARFKSVMTYNLPGMPPQKQEISLGKEEFIENVEKGSENIQDYDHLIQIENIKISSDGEKAFVKTRSTELVTMPVPTENGIENVPVEGESECTQILSLNKGVIQMFSASCNTTINFMEY